jgi:hypothetical protein
MSALTLTGLIPTIYNAMDIVSRENTGFIRAVGRDSSAERAAINEVVMSPVVPAMLAENLTVGNVAADPSLNTTINNVQMSITKARSVPFGLTGEENRGLNNAGTLGQINRDRITQALRTLANEVEADLAALHIAACRASGTAAGTPFSAAGDLTDFANMRQILEENGAPGTDLHLVLGSLPLNRLRGKQSTLFKVNEAGSDELLRTGNVGTIQAFQVGYSPKTVVSGGAVGTVTATVDASGYAIGATVLTMTAAASAILVGDIVTFAGDANQYVVAAISGASQNAGTITIAEPGLKIAMVGAKAVTIIATTGRNMFFHRGAIQLATRAPAMPDGGDDADDVLVVVDPVSGIAFEFAVYKQKRQVRYEVNLAWGVKMVAPRHCGLLIGA